MAAAASLLEMNSCPAKAAQLCRGNSCLGGQKMLAAASCKDRSNVYPHIRSFTNLHDLYCGLGSLVYLSCILHKPVCVRLVVLIWSGTREIGPFTTLRSRSPGKSILDLAQPYPLRSIHDGNVSNPRKCHVL
jgi:hypothetical protein